MLVDDFPPMPMTLKTKKPSADLSAHELSLRRTDRYDVECVGHVHDEPLHSSRGNTIRSVRDPVELTSDRRRSQMNGCFTLPYGLSVVVGQQHNMAEVALEFVERVEEQALVHAFLSL